MPIGSPDGTENCGGREPPVPLLCESRMLLAMAYATRRESESWTFLERAVVEHAEKLCELT